MVEVKAPNFGLINVVIIIGFAVLIGFFAFNFAGVTQETAKTTVSEVNRTSDKVIVIISNLTGAINDLTTLKAQELDVFRSGFFNLSNLMYKQVNLIEQERNETQKNLAMFLGTFDNQSTGMQAAINELNKDSNASREKQTQVFVDTLGLSQNLTMTSQKINNERNAIEKNQSEQFNEIIRLLGGNETVYNVSSTANPDIVPLLKNQSYSTNS